MIRIYTDEQADMKNNDNYPTKDFDFVKVLSGVVNLRCGICQEYPDNGTTWLVMLWVIVMSHSWEVA